MPAHLGHAVAGGLSLLLAAVVLVAQQLRARHRGTAADDLTTTSADRPGDPSLAGWLAVAVLGAATVHAAVVREHFKESVVLGAFFLLLSVLQGAYAAVVVVRPTRALLQAGAAANAAVVALWLYTRTFGIPFGVSGGEVEAVGVPDLLSTAFEVMAVVVAVVLLRQRSAAARAGWRVSPAQQLGAVLAVVLTSAVVATTGVS
jgi:hypothetical protein